MQGRYLFEYAIIRIVPRVEREEFLNVGIVLYCKEVEEHLQSFEKISAGETAGGQIAVLDMASRFRWLTATRSTIIQTSKVHPGFCEDPNQTIEKLYMQFVM